ncbi:MAG: TRAP transporter large permease subunit [Cloacibacillus porcorum]|uniref:Na+/H+ antiporter family protein n=1 Tax=Cloacibacillus porcorum TaxID=1197717 RepID=UPI0023572D86|nr:SLC13 family permease [Cloacibacillus porcorum]MCI5863936.1 TRAP transporter large permease subunit [Cloacibacillus porcorum]
MLLSNPTIISVLSLCVLCLFKVNVIMAMLVSIFVGGFAGGMGISDILSSVYTGLGSNAETCLAYLLMGIFAACMEKTGIAGILSRKVAASVKDKKYILILVLTLVAVSSQNLVLVHIAYIPILIPPLLSLMNKLKIDRRVVACCTAFGLKAPYIAIPVGAGLVFMGIIRDNMTDNGMPVTIDQIASVNWILGLAMLIGLLIAIFITYRRPREYRDIRITEDTDGELKMQPRHWWTLAAIAVLVIVQLKYQSLPLAEFGALVVIFLSGAVKLEDMDKEVSEGIRLMGFTAFVILIAGGYAQVLKDTGAVESLVSGAISIMGGSRMVAAVVIVLIGLFVTMGIGTSFGTIPIIAVIFVPLCQRLGFSPLATVILISAAAALGDAGSPASDTTLGPTCGLNVDGQHDHIWDTCVPTFLHFNIPLMIAAVIAAQIL